MDFVSVLIVLVLTCILLLPLTKSYGKVKRISKCIDFLPGERWFPVVGTIWRNMFVKREDYYKLVSRNRHPKYGPMLRGWFGSMPTVHIYKPEHAQAIFKSNTILQKGAFYKLLYPWLGQGLISGSGPKWRTHRKIITPAFHFKVLDMYGEIFAEKSEIYVDYLAKYVGKGYFDITQSLYRITLDIICETAMGVKFNCLEEVEGKEFDYGNAILSYCGVFIKRLANPLLANDFFFKFTKLSREGQGYLDTIHKFNYSVIAKRRAHLEEHQIDSQGQDELGRKQKLSFLDMLLTYQKQNKMVDSEIEEEINTFMFAGQDTTAATLITTFMALGSHPDVMKKVQDELDTIFADDPNRKITSQDLTEMDYMDRMLKEVFRCYCFVPTIARELQEDIEIDGVLIPSGVTVFISLEDLHHDPNHYPEPYKFDPDRFLPENSVNRHPYAFVPFSAGPRNCLGQKFGIRNSKTLLAYVLRRYNVKCQEKPEDMKYYCEIVLKPQNGLHIALESRR